SGSAVFCKRWGLLGGGVDGIDVVGMVDIITFALILLLGVCLALPARKNARGLHDRYPARHAPPPPTLDLQRQENYRNILRSNENAPGGGPSSRHPEPVQAQA